MILAALCLTACGGTEPQAPTPALATLPPAPVVFVGDSITARWDLSFVPNAINAGIHGYRSCELASRFSEDVLSHYPGTVVILAGINDIALDDAPTPQCIYDMAQRAMASGARVIVGTLLPDSNWAGAVAIHSDAEGAAAVERFNSELRLAAASYGFTLADYYPALINDDGMQKTELFVDGVHPNADGYAVMQRMLSPLLHIG